MAAIELKSTAFRREREKSWRELEALVGTAERKGLDALSARDLMRLPRLYRATLSALSVARGISLDRNVLAYLESLAARSYFQVYATRTGFLAALADFFLLRFPRAVRAARWPIAIAGLCLALGVAVGYMATLHDMDWFYTFMPGGLADGRTPTTSTTELRDILFGGAEGTAEMLNLFASYLFTHNTLIGFLSFALGIAFGVPVILLMFYNGLLLGALAGLYADRGLGGEFWGWILIHGTTELSAIVLCGGAGLVLARSVVFPSRHPRLEALARNGPLAGQIAIGAVCLFFAAALLEGFGRQLITETAIRYAIGLGALLFWALYFGFVGRQGDGET
jgi:uncharacterized membrane protein SpoIIM required for sporulation